MKVLSNIFRILIGIVFVFSGFVKVVDPLGVQYKFFDYFTAMGLDFLQPAALTFAVILSIAELVLGISLLFNLKPKYGAWGVLLFMSVFFPLTLWIALANPVHDCGCFGDAIILTNWQTFWKNVIIMFMAIIVFLKRNKFNSSLPEGIQWLTLLLFTAASIIISINSIRHLPIIDFRPYRIGENIEEGMSIPESEKDNLPEYETVVVYKNKESGEEKEFDVNNLPDDAEWEWIETHNKLIKEGYQPPIHDFSITTMPLSFEEEQDIEIIEPSALFEATYLFEYDGEIQSFYIDQLPGGDWIFAGVETDLPIVPENISLIYEKDGESKEFTLYDLPDMDWNFIDAIYYNDQPQVSQPKSPEDITDIVLAEDRYTFLLICYDISIASTKNQDKIHEIYEFAVTNDMPFMCLTASTEDDVKDYIERTEAPFDFYSTDPITLKTMVRAKPGLMLLKKGTVLDKWHHNDIPDVEDMKTKLLARSLEKKEVEANKYMIWMLIFGMFLFYSIIHILVNYLKRKHIIIDRKSWK